jgi:hypothetical protein
MFVPDGSALEAQVIDQIQCKLAGQSLRDLFRSCSHGTGTPLTRDVCFASTRVAAYIGIPQSASSAALVSVLPLFDFLGSFFHTFTVSRQLNHDARRGSELPSLETICIPTLASSQRCMDEARVDGRLLTGASAGDSHWHARLQWAESLIRTHGLNSITTIQAYIRERTESHLINDMSEFDRSASRGVVEMFFVGPCADACLTAMVSVSMCL